MNPEDGPPAYDPSYQPPQQPPFVHQPQSSWQQPQPVWQQPAPPPPQQQQQQQQQQLSWFDSTCLRYKLKEEV